MSSDRNQNQRLSFADDNIPTAATQTSTVSNVVRLEPIHSGHFMRSGVHARHDPSADDDDSDVDVDVCADDNSDTQPVTVDEKPKPVTFYKFGPKRSKSIAIDVSLGPLKRAITTAYSKLTTPKWKDFKGLRLDWKQRIRLNNVIWRAWSIEFRINQSAIKRKTPYCYFSVPDDDIHKNHEAGTGILEGMYWKRRFEAVSAQYRRWRHYYFHKIKIKSSHRDSNCALLKDNDHQDGLWLPPPLPPRSTSVMTPQPSMFYDDDLNNVFTDRLFDSLSQPYMFPDSKELVSARYGNTNADIIQPGLQPLQPSLDEIMTSLGSDLPIESTTTISRPQIRTEDPFDFFNKHTDSSLANVMDSAPDWTGSPTSTCGLDCGSGSTCPTTPKITVTHSGSGDDGRRSHSSPDLQTLGVNVTPRTQQQQQQQQQMQQQQLVYTAQDTVTSLHQQQQQQLIYTSRDYDAANVLMNVSTSNSNVESPVSRGKDMNNVTRAHVQMPYEQHNTDIMYDNLQYLPQLHVLNPHAHTLAAISPQPRTSVPTVPMPVLRQAPVCAGVSGGWLSPPVTPWLTSQSSTTTIMTTATPSPFTCSNNSMPPSRPPSKGALKAAPHKPIAQLAMHPTLSVAGPATGSISMGRPNTKRAIQSTSNVPITISPLQQTPPSLQPQVPPPLQQQAPLPANVNATKPGPAAKRGRRSAQSTSNQQNVECKQQQRIIMLHPEATVSTSSSLIAPSTSSTSSTNQRALSIQTNSVKVEVSQSSQPEQLLLRPAPITSAILSCTPAASKAYANTQEEAKVQVAAKKVAADSSSHRQPCSVDGEGDGDDGQGTSYQGEDRKRILHLHAEQSRRTALKDGFVQLTGLLPNLQGGALKPTNAVVLAKSAEYIRDLVEEEEERSRELDTVKQQIQEYHEKIKQLQSVLPTQSSSSSEKQDGDSTIKRGFEKFVAKRTKQSTKFWLLSKLMTKQFESYTANVSGENSDELEASTKEWAKDNATVHKLRPVASDLLVQLATNTPMLHNPEKLDEYIQQQVNGNK